MKKIILTLTTLILSNQSFALSEKEAFNNYFVESSFKREFLIQLKGKLERELGEAGWDEVTTAFNYSINLQFFDLVKQVVETDK